MDKDSQLQHDATPDLFIGSTLELSILFIERHTEAHKNWKIKMSGSLPGKSTSRGISLEEKSLKNAAHYVPEYFRYCRGALSGYVYLDALL